MFPNPGAYSIEAFICVDYKGVFIPDPHYQYQIIFMLYTYVVYWLTGDYKIGFAVLLSRW